jgi:hypothetical protein
MTRVLSSACIVLLLLGWSSRAGAGGKPPIAILGLEVYDNGSGIDPETTKAAKELTLALRDRAKAGTGPYTPVPGGDKELIDEKLLNNCDSEAPTCMAAIGAELGAEVLMYGKIEKSGSPGQVIYKVSIKLLNVNRKQLSSSTVETLPLAESTGVRAQTHAKAWYAKLAGAGSGGTVQVKANIDRGTVMLDDDLKGNLASGTLSIPGVAEGRHTLAIEAKDYQRYETSITVRNGETLSHTATLVEMSRKPSGPTGDPISVEGTVTATHSRSNVWKPIFYGTAVLEAGALGFTIFEWNAGKTNAGKISKTGSFLTTVGKTGADGKFVDESQCSGDSKVDAFDKNDVDLKHFKDACKNYTNTKIGWVVSGVVGVAVIGSFVMAFLRDSHPTETKMAGRGHKKRRELAITPIVTPDGGGATLQFDW